MGKLKDTIKRIWRFPLKKYYKSKLKNHDFSLITVNCIGGVIYHDCREQFRSPTVNLTIDNFPRFVANLRYYLSLVPTPNGFSEYGYPVCKIEDVVINGVHYSSHEDLISAWEKRKKRVNFENILIVSTDRHIKTEQDLSLFSNLPYPKIEFVSNPKLEYDFQVYIPGYESDGCLGDILAYGDIFGRRIMAKHFDFVKWLNENRTNQN